jgi:hypothetical protein
MVFVSSSELFLSTTTIMRPGVGTEEEMNMQSGPGKGKRKK